MCKGNQQYCVVHRKRYEAPYEQSLHPGEVARNQTVSLVKTIEIQSMEDEGELEVDSIKTTVKSGNKTGKLKIIATLTTFASMVILLMVVPTEVSEILSALIFMLLMAAVPILMCLTAVMPVTEKIPRKLCAGITTSGKRCIYYVFRDDQKYCLKHYRYYGYPKTERLILVPPLPQKANNVWLSLKRGNFVPV